MNAIWGMLNQSGAERLGWALIHSLWQGSVIAVIFAIARRAFDRFSPNARYLFACGMLLVLAAMPVVTFLHGPVTWGGNTAGYLFSGGATEAGQHVAGSSGEHNFALATRASLWLAWCATVVQDSMPWTVAVWILGVVLLSCRWAHGIWWLKRMRTQETEPVEAHWIAVLENLKCRFGIQQPVRLMRSALAEVPMVVGLLKPVILLPASTLAGLSPAQLEAIIAHELAHVRRYDHLVNAVQNVIETLLFYHPAVWWISRCIREEREHCCDDLVLGVCHDRLAYAWALFRLEELRGTPARLAFAASGQPLLQRVRRLVSGSPGASPVTSREFSGLSLLAIGCVIMVTGALMLLGPQTYSAAARIRIEQRGLVAPLSGGQQMGGAYDPYLIQTEFEVLQSQLILRKVVDQLNLTREWGKRFTEVLRRPEAIDLLRRQLDLRPVRNTSIIEIRVNDEDASQAALIANTIATTYADYRAKRQEQGTGGNMEALLAKLKEQDALLADAQAKVDRLGQVSNVVDSATPDGSVRVSAEALRKMENLRLENQAEYIRTRTLLEKLKELKPDELSQAITTAGIQDSNLDALLEQQSLVEQKLVATQKDFGPQTSEVIHLTAQAEDLRQKIKTRTEGILRGLEARVGALQQGLNDLSNEVARALQAGAEPAEVSSPLAQAKRELEERERYRQLLLTKLASEKIDTPQPRESGVEIVDQAFPPSRPSSPNRPRAFGLMVCGALVCLFGFGLARSGADRVGVS